MGLLDNIGNKLSSMSDDDKRGMALNLASGFAGMSGNPNTGNIMQGIARQQDALAARREKTSASDKLAAQSSMAIKMLGDKFPMLTQALQAGIISPNDAITAARKGVDVKVVGKSLVDSLGNVLFTSEDASSGSTTAFDTLKLRAKEAGLEEGTQAYQQFMIEGGAKKGMTLTVGKDGTVTMTQGGATVGKPKLTETQGKASAFYTRATSSGKIIDSLEKTGTEFGQWLLGQVPMTNWMASEEFQKLDAAKRDWISSVLRLESGAAIGPNEFANYDKAFFPQVGDKPATLEQKRMQRDLVVKTLKLQSGNAFPDSTTSGTQVKRYNPVTGKVEVVTL